MAWKRFSTFYALTWLLLALVPALSTTFGTSMNFGEVARRASAAMGVVGTTLCLLGALAARAWAAPGEYTQPPGLLSAGLLSTFVFAAFLDQGAVLEEAGWRGYATPLLQGGACTPLFAAGVVGVAWALWHLPRDVVSGVIERLGWVVTYVFLYLPAFTLGTVTLSVIASYFVNRIGGSLLPAVMVHGLANDAMGLAGVATIDRALTPDHQLTKAVPFLVFAIIVVMLSGQRLGAPAPNATALSAGRMKGA